MSELATNFIAHLANLKPGPLATLRRSLGFPTGSHVPAYPYVERFIATDRHPHQDARRLACYLVAGLYALHPEQATQSLATSLGKQMRTRDSDSIEKRFIALLGANAENLAVYLRQIVSLLKADDYPCDYAALLEDLGLWLNPHADPQQLDRLRQRWARDFYRAAEGSADTADND